MNRQKDSSIQVVIADDHPILRDGLRRVLEAEHDFAIVGEALDGHQALEITRRIEPNILILDLAMPGLSALEVLHTLSGTTLDTRSIVLAGSIERDEILKVFQLGARGLVMKDADSQHLTKAIRLVMAGQYWIGRQGVSDLLDVLRLPTGNSAKATFGLTARELEIVAAVTSGFNNREIARRFSISQQTVKHHLTKIFSKLGVSNRLELALFAIKENLIGGSHPPRL